MRDQRSNRQWRVAGIHQHGRSDGIRRSLGRVESRVIVDRYEEFATERLANAANPDRSPRYRAPTARDRARFNFIAARAGDIRRR